MKSIRLDERVPIVGARTRNRRRGRVARARGWVTRRYFRYQPTAIVVILAVTVTALILLDYAVPPTQEWLDTQARRHDVGVSLFEHVLVAGLVAAAAYFWVLGLKRQLALRDYRERAREKPTELVDWALGNPPRVRPHMSELLADAIARSPEPAVAVVQGRAGTGRTSFVVGLVRDLANRGLIPIPVLAPSDGLFDAELAKKAFWEQIDASLSSEHEADAIWHRARNTRDLVVLVDGLDDEAVTTLRLDRGRKLRQAIAALRRQNISVVLATTRELPLKGITVLREDLDLFSRDDARSFVSRATADDGESDDALDAVIRLHDPVDESSIAPYYLDLIVRLQENGISLDGLSEHTDGWRAGILERYLDGIEAGKIVPRDHAAGDDEGDDDDDEDEGDDPVVRARKAKAGAEEVARHLPDSDPGLMVERRGLEIEPRALDDARELNLLWFVAERIGFAADDLGAYLAATMQESSRPLFDRVRGVAERSPSKRRDRQVLKTFVFWHLRHEGRERLNTFSAFLDEAERERWTRPSVVATAVRIAGACEIEAEYPRVADLTRRCLDAVGEEGAPAWYTDELPGLVRALAGWSSPYAHELLWQLATSCNRSVEWPAAKALATAKGDPATTIEGSIETTLREAEQCGDLERLSRPGDALGIRVATLATILPAMRDGENLAEQQYERVARLCLDEKMSPLRGEMALSQGLKLALLNDRAAERNLETVRELLAGESVRFWHARIVLIHALLAYAWRHPESAGELRKQLSAIRESHPFVLRSNKLARRGLRTLDPTAGSNPAPLRLYMWTHERDAVRWVEVGRRHVTQLVADVVLLSNMIYRLREQDADLANAAAAKTDLPPCICDARDRHRIANGCDCGHGLCRDPNPPAVLAARATFSDSFCREQVRLVSLHGAPAWARRRSRWQPRFRDVQELKNFWDDQADAVAQVRRANRVP